MPNELKSIELTILGSKVNFHTSYNAWAHGKMDK